MARTKRASPRIRTAGVSRRVGRKVKSPASPRKEKNPNTPRSTPTKSKKNKAPTAPQNFLNYIKRETFTWPGDDVTAPLTEPLIETYKQCKLLTVTFANSPKIWFFRYCNPEPYPDVDGWTFPAGYYLAKKCTHGALYYLSYLRRYKIDGKWHNFNEFVDGGGRMELITSPDVLDAEDSASMYTVDL